MATNTKNPAILWNVDQSSEGSDIGKAARDLAQKNIGVKGLVQSATDHKFVTNISQNTTTGNMEIHVGQPTISDIGLLADNPSQSIVTDSSGAMTAASMLYDSAGGDTPGDTFVIDRVQQTSQGQVSASGKSLGTAAKKNVPASGNAATTEVVMGDDTRLTDSRTPVSHASTGTTYGAGSSTHYGHVKLYNNVTGENTDGAPDQKSVHDALSDINDDISDINETLETINTFRKITVDGDDFLDSDDTKKLDLYGGSNISLTPNNSTGRVTFAADTQHEWLTTSSNYSAVTSAIANSTHEPVLRHTESGLTTYYSNLSGELEDGVTYYSVSAINRDKISIQTINSQSGVWSSKESYLVPPTPTPTSGGGQYNWFLGLEWGPGSILVPTWEALPDVAELKKIAFGAAGLTPYTAINALESTDTPLLYKYDTGYAQGDYYVLSEKKASGNGYTFFGMSYNSARPTVTFQTVNPDDSVTNKKFDLQPKLTPGSGIAIDSDNTIMCTGSGQVVDGIYKQTTVGNYTTTIQFNINQENNPYLDLIKQNDSTSSITATRITNDYIQSYAFEPYADSYHAMLAVNSVHDTSGSSGTSAYTKQLPTALGSVYSTVESLSRATILGSGTRGFVDSNLGYLTAGSLSLRLINANATSTSNPLMPSCIPGELNFIKFGSKGQTLYFKHYTDTAWGDFDEYGSYVSCDDRDGMLALTTDARTITNRSSAQSAALTASNLGHMTFFPSTYYVHNYVNNYVQNALPRRVGMDLTPRCKAPTIDGNYYARMVEINIPAGVNEHTISLSTYFSVNDWSTGALMFFFIRESVKTNSGDSGNAINMLEQVVVEVDGFLAEQYGPFPTLHNNTFMMFHIGRDSTQSIITHPIDMTFQVLPNPYTSTSYAATTFKATIIVLPLRLE